MKKTHLNLRKLQLVKETISGLSAVEAQFVAGGAPVTVGCPAVTINCPVLTNGCQTVSICNDQCAVTWGCPPPSAACPVSKSCNCPTG